MTPELRAIADRLIYEQATLKHMVALAPEDAMGRPAGDRTAGETFGHLAAGMSACAAALEHWLASGGPLVLGNGCELATSSTDPLPGATRLNVTRALGSGLVSLVAALGRVPDAHLEPGADGVNALDALRGFGEHATGHAIELIEALPEVRMDPLVLNWVLAADFADAKSQAWQRSLFEEVQEHLASLPDEELDVEDEE